MNIDAVKPIAALIVKAAAPEIARHEQIIRAARAAVDDAELDERQDADRAATSKAKADRKRLELGQTLAAAKAELPHGTWLPFLQKLGIDPRNASNWMLLAQHTETKSETQPDVSDLPVPTLREAGADKRPRKADQQAAATLPHRNDVDAALKSLGHRILGYADAWPSRSRANLAIALRNMARAIEEMDADMDGAA